jgi:hypothetical protein
MDGVNYRTACMFDEVFGVVETVYSDAEGNITCLVAMLV